MGAQAAINAVHYNRIQALPDGAERDAFVAGCATNTKPTSTSSSSQRSSWSTR